MMPGLDFISGHASMPVGNRASGTSTVHQHIQGYPLLMKGRGCLLDGVLIFVVEFEDGTLGCAELEQDSKTEENSGQLRSVIHR